MSQKSRQGSVDDVTKATPKNNPSPLQTYIHISVDWSPLNYDMIYVMISQHSAFIDRQWTQIYKKEKM